MHYMCYVYKKHIAQQSGRAVMGLTQPGSNSIADYGSYANSVESIFILVHSNKPGKTWLD